MRQDIIATAFLAALLSITGAHAATDGVPKRKPGYWEITTVAPVSGMTKTKVCVGEDDDIGILLLVEQLLWLALQDLNGDRWKVRLALPLGLWVPSNDPLAHPTK